MPGMDKSVFKRVTDVKEQDAENYRYWQSVSVAERLLAVAQLTRSGYAMKGFDFNVERARRPVVELKRPRC